MFQQPMNPSNSPDTLAPAALCNSTSPLRLGNRTPAPVLSNDGPILHQPFKLEINPLPQKQWLQDRDAVLHALRSCVKSKNLPKARKIHSDILRMQLFTEDMHVNTALLTAYARCGALTEAQRLFSKLPQRDVVCWNALITGYGQNGAFEEVLSSFNRMQNDGFSPDVITFSSVLKACGSLRYLDMGEAIHTEVKEKGLLENNVVVGAALVNMYAKCGHMGKAQEVFDGLSLRNVVTWNALITGYVQNGLGKEALRCFEEMQSKGISPNAVTFICTLKACGSVGNLPVGEEIHAEIRDQGLLKGNIMLNNTLVDMYSKCGNMEKAERVFEELLVRNVVSWNVLITGYAQHGLGDKALEFFRQMQDEGISPNVITYYAVLRACSSIKSLEMGEEIHESVRRQGLLRKEIALCNTLIDMYAKCGAMKKAQRVFSEIPEPNVVSWNALIAGYSLNGFHDEALECFHEMRDENIVPDPFTFSCILKACGSLGSLDLGREIHADVSKQGLLGKDVVLGTTLLDMYSKCGMFEKARDIFEELPAAAAAAAAGDVVAWNAIMAMYAHLGQAKNVFGVFNQMLVEGVVPDGVAFLQLLTVCSHGGLLKEGQRIFDQVTAAGYGITPILDHYTCMVDLFSRAGHFEKAIPMMEKLESRDRIPLLLALMSACCKWVNVAVGQWAFDQSVQCDEDCEAAYVSMGNIYAAAGMDAETSGYSRISCGWTDGSTDGVT